MRQLAGSPHTVPFIVLIDTAETLPFTFQGLHADADKSERLLIVPTKWQAIGRHPNSLGDYSIDGFVGRVAVERKSMEDCQGTVLGWDTKHDRQEGHLGRRQRFEQELDNLTKVDASLIVVEASIGDCLRYMPEWGAKSRELNAKIFHRSVLAYMQDYQCVPWLFCDSRRLAEVATFRFLERHYKHHKNDIDIQTQGDVF